MALKSEYILHENGVPVERCIPLTVGEVVELAKAGVQVELAGRVSIDTVPPPQQQPAGSDISGGIRERYRQSQRAKMTPENHFGSFFMMPEMYAVQCGDKVYVFAYSGNAPPEVIEDDAAIYPSDALLARIHLMMQHAK